MDERVKVLRDQVKKGNASAAFDLAEAFKWGYYGDADPVRAARMYRICCRSKNKRIASLGFLNLGVLYYYGYLAKDEKERSRSAALAFDCFLKSAMMDKNPGALIRLADMYRYGQYVERDEGIAISLYAKAYAS